MIDLREIAVKVSSQFGWRSDPFTGKQKYHSGTDIVLTNDNIPSITTGIVEEVGYTSVLGNYIKIRNADGTIATYGHMNSPSNLVEGAAVSEGTIIGIQGSTGRSTGKHLHLTIRDSSGNLVDPEAYMTGGVSFDLSNISDTSGGVVSLTPTADSNDLTIVGKIIAFLSMVVFFILAFVFFLKAFDIKLI